MNILQRQNIYTSSNKYVYITNQYQNTNQPLKIDIPSIPYKTQKPKSTLYYYQKHLMCVE